MTTKLFGYDDFDMIRRSSKIDRCCLNLWQNSTKTLL